MSDDIAGLTDDAFGEFLASKGKRAKETVKKRRGTEARAHLAKDGRISSSLNERGEAQLNVRIPVALKNRLIEERDRRRAAGEPGRDNVDIVIEALTALLMKQ